jgi:16S rRNA (uracil1498-N3)-methyltransferase
VGEGLEPDGSGGHHFFVDDLDDPELRDDDRHHAARVLRLRPGEAITVSDGRGSWRAARFGDGAVEVAGEVVSVAPPSHALSVGFALVKGAKPELVIQKLCELGVDRIEPFVAERSVVRWDEARAQKAHDRWTSIVRGAAMQSRRVHLPELVEVLRFADVAVPPAVLADRGGRAPTLEDRRVLIGPEGGWSDTEREVALDRVGFGRHVLRAETAAIAVGAILVALRESLVDPHGSQGPRAK